MCIININMVWGIVFIIQKFQKIYTVDLNICRIVRLTSPNLNYFIIVGALCIYMSVYIRFYVTSNEIYHNIRCNVSSAVHTSILNFIA